jgi:hypothetical protein
MKRSILFCVATLLAGFAGLFPASAQTSASGQPVSVATPTPGPAGTTSTALNPNLNTALNSSITGGGVATGQGSMGTGVNVPPVSAAAPIVPGQVIINSNGTSVGAGNVAGSVQINNGGPGSVSGAPTPTSPIPTYVTPGTGLGTAGNAGTTTAPNPNPGSVQ